MTNEYVRLEGIDFGIIAGGTIGLAPQGILLYKPTTDLVPNINMSRDEIEKCLIDDQKSVNIDYFAVRKVEVNDSTIWRNKYCFDLDSMGIDPYEQVYWGRGDVCVELRNDIKLGNLIENILKQDTGLRIIS